MELILRIAFRNIFRQKARSILIGLGLFVSVIYMIMGNSFNNGIGLNILYKLVATNVIGHVAIDVYEKEGNKTRLIIHDKEGLIDYINKNIPNVMEIKESIITSVFAIGNGKGSVIKISGLTAMNREGKNDFKIISGDLEKFNDPDIENPLILEKEIAKTLKVTAGDVLRVKFNTIYGQVQTANFSVIALVKMDNPFMVAYTPGLIRLKSLKKLLGYKDNETQRLNIIIDKIKSSSETIEYADKLHAAFAQKQFQLNAAESSKDITSNDQALLKTNAISKPWRLAERSNSNADLTKKQNKIRLSSEDGLILNVVSLQEINEENKSIESSMSIVGIFVSLIILLIILSGILNTIRMNIKERTREIGTVRAVGMQKKLVIRSLILEAGMLTFISSILGVFASYGVIKLLSSITITTDDLNFQLLLDKGHFLFIPNIMSVITNILVIIILVMLTVYFPARKAAKKPVAEALGHYE